MVTINQKLSLFSNLLQRSINETFKLEMYDLQQEYSDKLQRSKEAADRQAAEIIRKAGKKAEAERTEQISRIRVEFKKEYMSIREKYFSRFMERITTEMKKFTESEKYRGYMLSLADKLKGAGRLPDSLVIYMTGQDIERHGEAVMKSLREQKNSDITLKEAPDSMIGGFIAEDPADRIRMNMSMSALIEDNRPYIMQALFRAIEAGDANDANDDKRQ